MSSIENVSAKLFVVIGLIGLASLGWPLEGYAQSLESLTAEQRAELDGHLQSARDAYESGDFEAAKPAFEAVYRLYPSADVLYRLALVYERLGEYDNAVQAYRDYLVKVPDDPERRRIEGVIRALENRNSPKTSTLALSVAPSDARVFVDGNERLEEADEDGVRTLVVPTGEIRIDIQKDGFITETKSLQLSPDQEYNLIVGLRSIDAGEDESQILPWALVGTGGLFVVAGAAFLGHAYGINSSLSEQYAERGDATRPPGFAELESKRDVSFWVGASTSSVGVLVGVLGVFLFEEDEAAVGMTPTEGGAALTLSGSF